MCLNSEPIQTTDEQFEKALKKIVKLQMEYGFTEQQAINHVSKWRCVPMLGKSLINYFRGIKMVKVKVTREDIAFGMANTCDKCPVSLAINRVLNGLYHSRVYSQGISICTGRYDDKYIMEPPQEVQEFIRKFDKELEVEPFEFKLEIPKEYLNVN